MIPFDMEGGGGSCKKNDTVHMNDHNNHYYHDDDDDQDEGPNTNHRNTNNNNNIDNPSEEMYYADINENNENDDNDRLALLNNDDDDDDTKHRPSFTTTTTSTTRNTTLLSVGIIIMLFTIMGMYQTLHTYNSSSSSSNSNQSGIEEEMNSNHPIIQTNNHHDQPNMMISLLKERFLHSSKRLMIAAPSNNNIHSTTAPPLQLVAQQFVHLHHMKTGGTSIDTLIRCSIDRLRQLQFTYEPKLIVASTTGSTTTKTTTQNSTNTTTPPPLPTFVRLQIPHTTIHECSESHYQTCTLLKYQHSSAQNQCIASVHNAAVLSYCAPLKDLYQYPFQWQPLSRTVAPAVGNHTTTTTTQPSQSSPLYTSLDTTMTTTNSVMTTPTAATALPIHAITILRHPVARVWSMYRFQTKACYQCRTLLEIYQQIDDEYYQTSTNNNTTTTSTTPPTMPIRTMCKSQLINHQTRNLLSSTMNTGSTSIIKPPNDVNVNDEISFAFNYTTEQIQNAIYNMQHVFTMIGLTEDMNTTAWMVGKVFPWLAEDLIQTLSDRRKRERHKNTKDNTEEDIWDPVFGIMPSDDDNDADVADTNDNEWVLRVHVPSSPSTTTTSPLRKCPIRHENASPTNNHCANNGRDHLPLPNVPPDEATVAAILAHNVADVQLYEAAVQQFALQQQVLLGKV